MSTEHGQLIRLGSRFTEIRLLQDRQRGSHPPPRRHGPRKPPRIPEPGAESSQPATYHPGNQGFYFPGTPEHAALFCHACWGNFQEENSTLCSACQRSAPSLPACIHGGEPVRHPHHPSECPALAAMQTGLHQKGNS